jgi:cbb3-type cytochrome oxidase maturation protein
MDILFLLIPLSVLLVFALMAAFLWALHGRQFEDLDREGTRILGGEGDLDGDQGSDGAVPRHSRSP